MSEISAISPTVVDPIQVDGLVPHDGIALSLFLREDHAGDHQHVRLRALIHAAEAQSRLLGLDEERIGALLSVAHEFARGPDRPRRGLGGVALFSDGAQARMIELPELEAGDQVLVMRSYSLVPLIRCVDQGSYLLLTLSQNGFAFFECSRAAMSQRELPGVPPTVHGAASVDHAERQRQTRIRSVPGGEGGQKAGRSYTTGGNTFDMKELAHLRSWFQRIAAGIRQAVGATPAPLVLAGVEWLLPVFRECYSGTIVAGEIHGSPAGFDERTLHERSWKLAEPALEGAQRDAAKRIAEGNPAHASRWLAEALRDAHQGRVAAAFVPIAAPRWGTFDAATGSLEEHPVRRRESDELINLLARRTLLGRGSVYAVAPQDVPGGGDVAALLRY